MQIRSYRICETIWWIWLDFIQIFVAFSDNLNFTYHAENRMKKFKAMEVRMPFWQTIPSCRIDGHDPEGCRNRPTTVSINRYSTCALVFGCWELSHMIFIMLRKRELFVRLSKFTRWQLFLLKTVLGCCFEWKQAVLSFSSWEKSRDSIPNCQKIIHAEKIFEIHAKKTSEIQSRLLKSKEGC